MLTDAVVVVIVDNAFACTTCVAVLRNFPICGVQMRDGEWEGEEARGQGRSSIQGRRPSALLGIRADTPIAMDEKHRECNTIVDIAEDSFVGFPSQLFCQQLPSYCRSSTSELIS